LTPLGLREELALEEAALLKHQQNQQSLWRQGLYLQAKQAQQKAERAAEHIRKLEALLPPGEQP
jgi:hypothetical protein